MRFNGGERLSWSRIERILSGRPGPELVPAGEPERERGEEPARAARPGRVPFAELHAASSYHFFRGASAPRALVERARALGLAALGVLDRDGFYGVAEFAEAAAEAGLPTVLGAEITLPADVASGVECPTEGTGAAGAAGAATPGSGETIVLPVLCRGPEGYRRLSHLVSDAHMATGHKDRVRYPPLADIADALGGECLVLAGEAWAARPGGLLELVDAFGPERVIAEYPAEMLPGDADARELVARAAAEASGRAGSPLRGILSARPVAATRDRARLAGVKRALGGRQSLGEARPRAHPVGGTWLRSGEQLARLAPGFEGEIAETVRLAAECAFTLDLVAPELPPAEVPAGHTEASWLRHLTEKRAPGRYAGRPEELLKAALRQADRELDVIENLGFPGYFLIVEEIVSFCKQSNILCQGRGSAANSVVCFCLGITNAEPVSSGLLFERFLSPERDGPPDIDLDIEATRREEVIQHVFQRYGRERAGQVAAVITYRTKGAVRDAARALGYPAGSADAWSKGLAETPEQVAAIAGQLAGQPRHLSIHSGGMVICDRPLADVVPTEWARKDNRSVLQWDKDACAAVGLVKFDLLGLGMLEALHHMIDEVRATTGETVNLWELDTGEKEVYRMLAVGDAVGVFQVESRAQLQTLPRLKPERFFDLVVEVALIRPGPIQGGSVHPYLRRKNGLEEPSVDHPVLHKALDKTLGIPLFQEQLMQIAVDAAGFSGAEADALRRAMGQKRSPERMAALKDRFLRGLEETNGIRGEVAENLWQKIVAFAAYGFPESHAQSFASIVFFSAWFKLHHPAEFCAGLLQAQPMGFYSPQSLIHDARRHGVEVRGVDVRYSKVESFAPEPGALRLGLGLIGGLGKKAAGRIVAAREDGEFASLADLSRRAGLTVPQAEALARAGALEGLGLSRRAALWEAGVAATECPGMLPGLTQSPAPALPGMSPFELTVADIAATGVSPDIHPMEHVRAALDRAGVVPADRLLAERDGKRIRVAGVVTHRQRPATASGVVFFGLEDETGLINVTVTPGLWRRHRTVARTARALVVRGLIRNANGVANLSADLIEALPVGELLSAGSRDFR